MNKKFLSALLFGALMVTSTGTFVSCKDYDDDIEDLRTQINANAKAIEKINSLITGGSVISKVDKSNNGVTVTLSNGDSFELKNGEDGDPATVWTIGEDGYWYKDDVKTDYKAVGTNGNQGAPGTNGAFYRPNVETGFFDYVTIDAEGKETVKATDITWKSNDGSITAAVTEGDVILSGVKGLPDGKVVIPRNNLLRSLVFVPEIYVEGIPGMPYYNVAYAQKKINDKKDSKNELFSNVDTKKDYNVELNKGIIAQYHVNPTNANATDLQKLALATRNVPYITARSENFEATATYKSFADGILTVGIELGDGISSWLDQSKNDSIPVAALQVIREGKDTITSDYATLYKAEVKGVKIANPCAKANEHYRYEINSSNLKTADAAVVLGDKVVWNETPINYADCDTTLVDGKTLDLKSIVAAHGMLKKGDDKSECLKLNTDVYGWIG